MDSDPGYVTVHPTVKFNRYNAVVMKAIEGDEHIVFRISEPLRLEPAIQLARSWAAALGWRLELHGVIQGE